MEETFLVYDHTAMARKSELDPLSILCCSADLGCLQPGSLIHMVRLHRVAQQ